MVAVQYCFDFAFRLAQWFTCAKDLSKWMPLGCKATKRTQCSWTWKRISVAIYLLCLRKNAVSRGRSWRRKFLPQAGFSYTEGSKRGTSSAALEVIPPQNNPVVWVRSKPSAPSVELYLSRWPLPRPSWEAWKLFTEKKMSSLFHARVWFVWIVWPSKVLWIGHKNKTD